MKTFKHQGKCGDILMSLPAIRELGGGILYVPQNGPEVKGLYDNMRELLLQQPYITEVREYPSGLEYGELAEGIHIDYDLDLARNQPHKGLVHLVKRYLDTFKVHLDNWQEPWLTVRSGAPFSEPYTVINYTGRHILNESTGMKSRVNWKEVVKGIDGQKYFVGTEEEYKYCLAHIADIPWVRTNTILEVAVVIKGASKVYCNQSSVLALAQGLSKEYWLDVKPSKFNCVLRTKNEHIL